MRFPDRSGRATYEAASTLSGPVRDPLPASAPGTALISVGATPTKTSADVGADPDLPVLDRAEVDTARRYADASRAASTQRAYAGDWRRFSRWCAARGLDTLPADPRVVAVFLSAEADAGAAPPPYWVQPSGCGKLTLSRCFAVHRSTLDRRLCRVSCRFNHDPAQVA